MKKIVLASSSPYRKALLQKIIPVFDCFSPDIDETNRYNLDASTLVQQLSLKKAQACSPHFSDAYIIGSDQVALLKDTILGKPITHANAVQQLQQASGQLVTFYTGLTLFNSQNNQAITCCDTVEVKFRTLSNNEIEHYLQREQPYQCAGSFKSEGLGITLFEYIHCDDPNSLIGLPLIQLCHLFRQQNVNLLTEVAI